MCIYICVYICVYIYKLDQFYVYLKPHCKLTILQFLKNDKENIRVWNLKHIQSFTITLLTI